MITFSTRCLALTAVAAAAVFFSGCATTHERSAADSGGAFVHIKSGPDETHRVMMGLRMAQIMAEDRDVLVYLDVDAIGLVLRDSPDLAMEPFGSSHAAIRDLIDRGVTVFACPGCLQAAGNTPEDLMPGVRVAEKDAFFDFTDGRILTIDY